MQYTLQTTSTNTATQKLRADKQKLCAESLTQMLKTLLQPAGALWRVRSASLFGRLALVATWSTAAKLTTLCPAGTVTRMHASRTSLKLGPNQRSRGRPSWLLSLSRLTCRPPPPLPTLLQRVVAPTAHVRLPPLAGLAPLRSSRFVRLPQ